MQPSTRSIPLYVEASAQAVAERGVAGATAPLPHLDTIQESFGHHDVTHARAAVGGPAHDAAAKLGTGAFAIGDRVGFRQEPDVRQAAHEAAHVVQQQRGVQLDGGVGRPGDAHEQAANRVADAVVAGQSAQPLLDAMPIGTTHRGVQKDDISSVRAFNDEGNEQIVIATTFRDFGVLFTLTIDPDTAARFDADATLEGRLRGTLSAILNPVGGPIPETPGFLNTSLVRQLIEQDLPFWATNPSYGLPSLTQLLETRAEVFARQQVRGAVEAYLGVDPGSVDWPALLPGVRMEVAEMGGGSLREASHRERVELLLLLLEREVAGSPRVIDPVTPPTLASRLWTHALSTQFLSEEAVGTFSEKFLGAYVEAAAALEFVPTGFDIERYRPSGTDLAADARHEVLDTWVDSAGPELTTKWVLDNWTVSGLDFQVYLRTLDIDAKKPQILDYLADAYMKEAKNAPAMMRAIVHMADERARFAIVARLVHTGRAAEKRNGELLAKIDDPEPEYDEDVEDLLADPKTYYESAYYVAWATRTALESIAAGASYDEALVSKAVQVAGKAKISKQLGLGAFLVAALTELGALADVKKEQRKKARDEIAERVDLSWDRIKQIIDDRGRAADVFIDNTWVPMLKKVATEWVTANYEEIKKFHDKFAEQLPQVTARYRLAAWIIEDTANQLESGEITRSTLNGRSVDRDDVKDLRNAVKVMRAKADDLESPRGKFEKYVELSHAVEAFTNVKADIASGKIKPQNYGQDVVVEAKKRLGIGVFEHALLWQQATRQVVVRDNPFQAYAIAMWRVEDIVDTAASNLLSFFGRGLLTIGSLLLPGVGGLILAAIDIGISVYSSSKNLSDAKSRLGLARLDTELNIQGITVAEAEHAVKIAWVGLVIDLALAGLFTAIGATAGYKALQRRRLPNLMKLAERDAKLAEWLVQRCNGSTKAADALLGHFAGDANLLVEALAYATDGQKLVELIATIKNAEILHSLLVGAGSDVKLLELLERFKEVRRLDQLLGIAKPQQLLRLMDIIKDEAKVAALLEATGSAPRAFKLLQAGLSVEHAIKLQNLGEDAVRNFFRALVSGDAQTASSLRELLRLNAQGTVSNEVTATTLARTADFMEKYPGRVSGDFVSRFSGIAQAEADVAKAQSKLRNLPANATKQQIAGGQSRVAEAEAELARANAEVNLAEDILQGKTTLGSDRTVHGIPRSNHPNAQTPEFRVGGAGSPPALVEVKAVGEPAQALSAGQLQRTFRKAASQLAAQSARTGEAKGLIRLDARSFGEFPLSNEQLRKEVARAWGAILKDLPGRSNTVGAVEILDGTSGGRLVLNVDANAVSIDAALTTRLDP